MCFIEVWIQIISIILQSNAVVNRDILEMADSDRDELISQVYQDLLMDLESLGDSKGYRKDEEWYQLVRHTYVTVSLEQSVSQEMYVL
jgi:hypothetical protein